MVLGADEEEKDGDRDTKRGEWVKEENGKEGRDQRRRSYYIPGMVK